MDTMSGYIVSLADTLSKAERKVDALVLDPVTSTWTAMGEKQHLRDKIRNDFSKLQKALISSQLDYYIIDPQLLARGIADSNGITVKDETYRVLVIPPALNIEKDAWKVIKEYMEKGGNINCNIKCRAKFGKSIAYWNKFYVYTAISMADL